MASKNRFLRNNFKNDAIFNHKTHPLQNRMNTAMPGFIRHLSDHKKP